jgi:hypothetical protein
MRIIVVLTLSIALCGCGIIQRQQAQQRAQEQEARMKAAAAEATAAINDCRQLRLAGEIKTFAESVRCANLRITAAYQNASYPYMDLIFLFTSARLVGAEKVDKGELTEAEVQLQISELMTRVSNEERRRQYEAQSAQNQAMIARAAQTQAAGQLLQGLSAFSAAVNPPTVTCVSAGPVTQCR